MIPLVIDYVILRDYFWPDQNYSSKLLLISLKARMYIILA